jgi:hypothetical protein
MVLMGRVRPLVAVAAICASSVLGVKARAQSAQAQSSALHEAPNEYQALGVRSGNLILYPELLFGIEHDSNIFAEPSNEKGDEIFHLIPQVRGQVDEGLWKFRFLGEADIKRYAKHQSENSVGAIAQGEATFSPHDNETIHALAGWRRLVEDRGDPEANPGIGVGPRIANMFEGQLDYHRARGVWLIDASASATKFDYVAADDVFRNHLALSGQLTAGRQVGGLTFATVTAFVQKRTFDRKLDLSGFDRDATTYGARAGIQITPGGIFEGGASIGVFRFNPVDVTIDPYTGISASANLIYRPTERTALLLDAFRGNVATFRTGAQSRTDTRVGVTLQQEVHHDIFAHLSGYVRDTVFRGSGISEKTYVAELGTEYLLNRHFTIGAVGRYGKRTSDDPFQEFERTRLMGYVRFQY